MKIIITIILLSLTQICFSQSKEELNMMYEINKIRLNPKSYIPIIENYVLKLKQLDSISNYFTVSYYKRTYLKLSNKNNEHENIGDKISKDNDFYNNKIKESLGLIKVLSELTPMDTLIFNKDIYPLTKEHAYYLKEIGCVGHIGKGGKLLKDRIKKYNCSENVAYNKDDVLLELLIDYGVNNKGHRNNILERNIQSVSIVINDFCVVQNFIR
jgi:hypothetical protein